MLKNLNPTGTIAFFPQVLAWGSLTDLPRNPSFTHSILLSEDLQAWAWGMLCSSCVLEPGRTLKEISPCVSNYFLLNSSLFACFLF